MSDKDIEEFMNLVGNGHIDNRTEIAIIDFLGYITTRDGEIRVGSAFNPTPLLEYYRKWKENRGNINDY